MLLLHNNQQKNIHYAANIFHFLATVQQHIELPSVFFSPQDPAFGLATFCRKFYLTEIRTLEIRFTDHVSSYSSYKELMRSRRLYFSRNDSLISNTSFKIATLATIGRKNCNVAQCYRNPLPTRSMKCCYVTVSI